MIHDLHSFPDYRRTDMPWAVSTPAHWSQRRMKFLFQERVQKGFPREPLLAATQTRGVVRKEDYGSRTVTAQKDLHLLKLVEPGDFVISLRSFQGGLEIAHCRGIISPAYTVLSPRPSARSGYFAPFFKSAGFVKALTLFVTGIREGQNIDYGRLSRAYLPVPPPDEQTAIVRYLNHVGRRINAYIRAKQKLLALLNDEKQAIIHRATTGGLSSDVEMKPAGIPGVGEIPEHWSVQPLKYHYREVDDRSRTGAEELLSVSHLTGITPRSQKTITMFKAASYVGHKLCRPGDLVINTMWAWMGALGVAHQTGIVSPSYAVYRPLSRSALTPEFADILLRSEPYIAEYICRSTGIRASRLRLYPEQFLHMKTHCPPKPEQKAILEWIAQETEVLSRSGDTIQREIDLIREYHTRLMTDVVTGQLDVREAAAKLPDETPADETPEPEPIDEEIEEDALAALTE